MKVHKITLYIPDFDSLGAGEVQKTLENTHYPNYCIAPQVMSVETREIGDWSDDHPLNSHATSDAYIKTLFGGAV